MTENNISQLLDDSEDELKEKENNSLDSNNDSKLIV